VATFEQTAIFRDPQLTTLLIVHYFVISSRGIKFDTTAKMLNVL